MQDPRVAGWLYTEESPFRALIVPDSQSVNMFKTLNCTHKANFMVSELHLNTTAEKRKSLPPPTLLTQVPLHYPGDNSRTYSRLPHPFLL